MISPYKMCSFDASYDENTETKKRESPVIRAIDRISKVSDYRLLSCELH